VRSGELFSTKSILKALDHPSSRRAICLLSGGLDSATCLGIAREEDFDCYCLSFDYGQRHAIELRSAALIARQLQAREHRTIKIGLRVFGGSALTSDIEVPKHRREDPAKSPIPVTYVPARNTIFLSFALAYAEVVSASDIFIGVNAIDYSGYPDCRPEFIRAFEEMANLATKAGVEGTTKIVVHAPLIAMTKVEIVRKAVELGIDLSFTHSCYDPDERGCPCGACDACVLRSKAFHEAGLADPTVTALQPSL
jgi:7-cyano-7-deazaguanine synthase